MTATLPHAGRDARGWVRATRLGPVKVPRGLTHAARGNAKGATTLIQRGTANLAPYAADPPHGVAVDALVRWAADGGAGPPPRLS